MKKSPIAVSLVFLLLHRVEFLMPHINLVWYMALEHKEKLMQIF